MGVISREGNANTQTVIWGGRGRSKNRSPGWAEESRKGLRCEEKTERKEDQDRVKREVTRVPAATPEGSGAKNQRPLLGVPLRGGWCPRRYVSSEGRIPTSGT